ncbi:MAG: GrpB family protein [Ilumatobacteraceae bacterium]
MIEVVEYDPQWATTFQQLAARYGAALVAVPVVAIEHVGSTSVVSLAAKPVIDIDIVVAAPHVGAAIEAMQRIGFASQGEQGIAERWALQAPAAFPRTNTYVVVEGCLSLRNHLGVRTVLRTNVELRDRYGALKQALAAQTDDIEQYIEGKSALLTEILSRAGLTDAELLAIEAANRAS